MYNQTGQNEKAEQCFRTYLTRDPNNAQALYSLGLVLSELRKYDESLETLLKAAKADPKYPRINHNIGMLYDFMKDKEKAEAYLKKEIEVAGDLNSRMELLQFYLTNNLLKKALVLGNEIPETISRCCGCETSGGAVKWAAIIRHGSAARKP